MFFVIVEKFNAAHLMLTVQRTDVGWTHGDVDEHQINSSLGLINKDLS